MQTIIKFNRTTQILKRKLFVMVRSPKSRVSGKTVLIYAPYMVVSVLLNELLKEFFKVAAGYPTVECVRPQFYVCLLNIM